MAIPANVGKYSWMQVVDVMTKDPLTVTSTETIGQADEVMYTNNIRQLPVVQGKELWASSPIGISALSSVAPCSKAPR